MEMPKLLGASGTSIYKVELNNDPHDVKQLTAIYTLHAQTSAVI